MYQQRNRRVVMVTTVIWCLQLVLTIFVMEQILQENTRYLFVLQAALLVSLLFRSRVMLRQFLASFYRDRRYVQRASPEVIAERQRIARDLHDGVGSQLTAAMAMLDARNPKEFRVLQELQMCLLGIRLTVDALSPSRDPLTVRLASLRHRIQPALEQCNIRLVWNIPLPDGLPVPTDATASEIVFIMQEALSNVLHHAHATEVVVTTSHDVHTGVWRFEVCDKGVGLPAGGAATEPTSGYGVKTMRDRALRAGLFLTQDTRAGGGTRVLLEARGYWQFETGDMFLS